MKGHPPPHIPPNQCPRSQAFVNTRDGHATPSLEVLVINAAKPRTAPYLYRMIIMPPLPRAVHEVSRTGFDPSVVWLVYVTPPIRALHEASFKPIPTIIAWVGPH